MLVSGVKTCAVEYCRPGTVFTSNFMAKSSS